MTARGTEHQGDEDFAATVLRWGASHRRSFPWRLTRDPWHILSSEVMLQQTQAPRVVQPYLDWITAFPNPGACATAGPAAALRAWASLGYNGRAVRLYKAACAIVQEHHGEVPNDLGKLEALPGVGPYTARAVMVFAFGVAMGVLDTNVTRVLSRAVLGSPLGRKEGQQLADRLAAPLDPWAYNQTLFDIGVAHCRARAPRCVGCPLKKRCAWAMAGYPSPDPSGPKRAASPFSGSDRQGRGRLVHALRSGPLCASQIEAACGCEDPTRTRRLVDGLVRDGLATWSPEGTLGLP